MGLNLTSWSDDQPETSSLSVANGGTILVPKLTNLYNVDLNLKGTGTLDTSSFVTHKASNINISNVNPNLSNLTDVTSSGLTLTNTTLDMSKVTEMSWTSWVLNQGTNLDLSQANNISYSNFWVRDGVKFNLPSATSYTTDGTRTIEVKGTGSEINLSSLATMTGEVQRLFMLMEIIVLLIYLI
ncbi:MAG: hypothetical protein GPJ22_19015 [Microcystis aeruginosa LL13-03]|nr:hypothetical protein [Microcystis aeruginosa LL13-03]